MLLQQTLRFFIEGWLTTGFVIIFDDTRIRGGEEGINVHLANIQTQPSLDSLISYDPNIATPQLYKEPTAQRHLSVRVDRTGLRIIIDGSPRESLHTRL